jgi:hypothetical protein
MKRLAIPVFLTLVLLASAGSLATAQEGRSLRFQKTVDFKTDKLVELGAVVGPVRVSQMELSLPSGNGGLGSIVGRIRGGGSSETHSTLRASFDSENPEEDEWVVTYTLDFLDAKGKLIDRATGKQGLEGEARVVKIDHSILTYVIPLIDRVEVRLEARLD